MMKVSFSQPQAGASQTSRKTNRLVLWCCLMGPGAVFYIYWKHTKISSFAVMLVHHLSLGSSHLLTAVLDLMLMQMGITLVQWFYIEIFHSKE